MFLRTLGQFYSPYGELYCYAVIFERNVQVVLPSAVLANKISLKSPDFNSTSRKGNITLCVKHRISLYKRYYPKKSFVFSSSGSFLSYTVTSREFVCQIPLKLKITVLSNPAHILSVFLFVLLFECFLDITFASTE